MRIIKRYFQSVLMMATFLVPFLTYSALSCTVATTCPTDTTVFKMSGTTNAHSEIPTNNNYNQLVCCSGVTGLSNACSGNFATVLKLSTTTNAHVQQNDQSGYLNDVCLSVPAGNSVQIAYQASNCTNYDTIVSSISAVTNAQVGTSTAYTTKVCAKIMLPQSISFSISDNVIGFGTLTSSAARYASGDALGSTTEIEAHNIQISSNATYGYAMTVQGSTLSYGTPMITAIGGTNTASSVGSEQFGLRMTATGGIGTVTVPYAASGFAYSANSTTSAQVASATSGDSVTTTYSVRYLANIGGDTEDGAYTTNLLYVVTANF